MHLLFDVKCSNPDADLNCECAVLEISQTLCARLQAVAESVMSLRRALPELYEVYCWGSAVDFYSYSLIAACDDCRKGWIKRLENAGHAVLPAGIDLGRFEPQRSECQQEIARYVPASESLVRKMDECFEFSWTAIPKHGDFYVTTRAVTLPQLRRYLAGGQTGKRSGQPLKPKRRREAKS
jgi:hypothetical protein